MSSHHYKTARSQDNSGSIADIGDSVAMHEVSNMSNTVLEIPEIRTLSCARDYYKSIDNKIEHDDSAEEFIPTKCDKMKSTPILKDFLTTSEVLCLLRNRDEKIIPSIPAGKKENVRYLISNGSNMLRMSEGKKCEFFDDCGAWNTRKGKQSNLITCMKIKLRWSTFFIRMVCIPGRRRWTRKRSMKLYIRNHRT